MNTFSSFRMMARPEPFPFQHQPPEIVNYVEGRQRHSFDLSAIQPLSYKPLHSGDLILSDMKEELSFIKSDIQKLMRSEQENENMLMMGKLQTLNQELRK